MSKINCGIGNLKKNQKRGSMKQCSDKGQIRYYGLKKVDKRIIDNLKKDKKMKISRGDILKKLTVLRVKIKNNKSKIMAEKDKEKKEKLKDKTRKIIDEYNSYKKEYEKLDNKKYKLKK